MPARQQIFGGLKLPFHLLSNGPNLTDQPVEKQDLRVLGIRYKGVTILLNVFQTYGHYQAKVLEIVNVVLHFCHNLIFHEDQQGLQ